MMHLPQASPCCVHMTASTFPGNPLTQVLTWHALYPQELHRLALLDGIYALNLSCGIKFCDDE